MESEEMPVKKSSRATPHGRATPYARTSSRARRNSTVELEEAVEENKEDKEEEDKEEEDKEEEEKEEEKGWRITVPGQLVCLTPGGGNLAVPRSGGGGEGAQG